MVLQADRIFGSTGEFAEIVYTALIAVRRSQLQNVSDHET